MTRLEKVSEKMGWDLETYPGCAVNQSNSEIRIAKLLQQRMVGDGWDVKTTATKNGFHCEAEKYEFNVPYVEKPIFISHYGGQKQTEPSAIFELFCRVYGIKEDGE